MTRTLATEVLGLKTVEAFLLRQAKRPHFLAVKGAKSRVKIDFAAGMIVAARKERRDFQLFK